MPRAVPVNRGNVAWAGGIASINQLGTMDNWSLTECTGSAARYKEQQTNKMRVSFTSSWGNIFDIQPLTHSDTKFVAKPWPLSVSVPPTICIVSHSQGGQRLAETTDSVVTITVKRLTHVPALPDHREDQCRGGRCCASGPLFLRDKRNINRSIQSYNAMTN